MTASDKDSDVHDGPNPEKLMFVVSPLSKEDSTEEPLNSNTVQHMGYRSELKDEPILLRRADATNLEVLYDLFLAALSIFNSNQQIAEKSGVKAYAGFYCLLWTTWFLTGMFDVRFVTDSVASRCSRAIHLGVLVGFAVVSPDWDPSDQDHNVFQAFSLILMVSRLCLTLEYGSVILHLKRYKKTLLPLAIMAALHFATAMIYLGVGFRFRHGNSRVFIAWYIVSVVMIIADLRALPAEIVIGVGLSYVYPVLTFQGTHMMNRMSLLTLIIFGEGTSIAIGNASRAVNVVGNAAWTPQMIGIITACMSLIFILFMIYFDWMRRVHLPGWRQMTWVLLHFPLHMALTLLLEGCGQFIVIWQIVTNTFELLESYTEFVGNQTTPEDLEHFSENFASWAIEEMDAYPKMLHLTYLPMEAALINMTEHDSLEAFMYISQFELETDEDVEHMAKAIEADADAYAIYWGMQTVLNAMVNVIGSAFGIDYTEDTVESIEKTAAAGQENVGGNAFAMTNQQMDRADKRLRIVFQYTFIAAGTVLAVMNAIYIISMTQTWRKWDYARVLINFVIALGVALVSLVSQFDIAFGNYGQSPWIPPTVTISYLIVLILTHVRGGLPVADVGKPGWAQRFLPGRTARQQQRNMEQDSVVHLGNEYMGAKAFQQDQGQELAMLRHQQQQVMQTQMQSMQRPYAVDPQYEAVAHAPQHSPAHMPVQQYQNGQYFST